MGIYKDYMSLFFSRRVRVYKKRELLVSFIRYFYWGNSLKFIIY